MNRVILADLVNGQNIWMIKPNYRACFSFKPLQPVRITSKARGQKFERGFTPRCNIGSQIDFTHPAAADPFGNFVVADGTTEEQISLPLFNYPRCETNS